MDVNAIKVWGRTPWLGKLGLLALALFICVGVSAHAALRAIVAQDAETVAVGPAQTGYEAQDHFPGAAEIYAADPPPAPQQAAIAGATGTIALPDIPLPPEASAVAGDSSVHPAQPFSMRGTSDLDRSRALQCLTAAIYYEAASEPDVGQQAVAQVILNRVRHPAFPATVCGVVYQGSEHSGCQFSFACDGATNRVPTRDAWIRAARVALAALNGRVVGAVGLATHYHTYAVTPVWNRSLVMTAVIGAHFFHRWQGWWGTPAAFHQLYIGGEPLPGPHPRAETPMTLAAVATIPVVPLAPQRDASTPTSDIQPAYADSGRIIAGSVHPKTTSAVPTTDDSQILEKWKDSGKPLR